MCIYLFNIFMIEKCVNNILKKSVVHYCIANSVLLLASYMYLILFFIESGLIRSHEKEIEMLKTKIAQDLAVMPQDTFGPAPTCATSKLRLNSEVRVAGTKIRSNESPCPGCTVSNLDPNATAYTPKSSLVASTEA